MNKPQIKLKKYSSMIFQTKSQLIIFFFLPMILPKVYCDKNTDDKIESICLNAELSIKSYFEEKQELPEQFRNLDFADEISENDLNSAINLLLIDEDARNKFMKSKKNEKKYVQIIIKLIIIISVLFFLDFEMHFFFRL